jgi:hypothetical protein
MDVIWDSDSGQYVELEQDIPSTVNTAGTDSTIGDTESTMPDKISPLNAAHPPARRKKKRNTR